MERKIMKNPLLLTLLFLLLSGGVLANEEGAKSKEIVQTQGAGALIKNTAVTQNAADTKDVTQGKPPMGTANQPEHSSFRNGVAHFYRNVTPFSGTEDFFGLTRDAFEDPGQNIIGKIYGGAITSTLIPVGVMFDIIDLPFEAVGLELRGSVHPPVVRPGGRPPSRGWYIQEY